MSKTKIKKDGLVPIVTGIDSTLTCELTNKKVTAECWGCGKKEVKGEARFRSCPKCDALKIVPSLFCSDECFRDNWPRHKAFHKEMKEKNVMMKSYYDEMKRNQEGLDMSQQRIIEEEDPYRTWTQLDHDNEDHQDLLRHMGIYKKVMAEGYTDLHSGDIANATKKFRKAQKINPFAPEVYACLGTTYLTSGKRKEGMEFFEASVERWAYGSLVNVQYEEEYFMNPENSIKLLSGYGSMIANYLSILTKTEAEKESDTSDLDHYKRPDWCCNDVIVRHVLKFATEIGHITLERGGPADELGMNEEQLLPLNLFHAHSLLGSLPGENTSDNPHSEKRLEERTAKDIEKAAECLRAVADLRERLGPAADMKDRICAMDCGKPANLRRRADDLMSYAKKIPKRPLLPFYEGCFVVINGLTSAVGKTMNLKLAKVKTMDTSKDGRAEVLIDGFDKPKSLKYSNLNVLPLSDREIALFSCLSLDEQWNQLRVGLKVTKREN